MAPPGVTEPLPAGAGDISSSRLRTAIARRMSVHVELSPPGSFAGPTRTAPALVITSLAAMGSQYGRVLGA